MDPMPKTNINPYSSSNTDPKPNTDHVYLNSDPEHKTNTNPKFGPHADPTFKTNNDLTLVLILILNLLF